MILTAIPLFALLGTAVLASPHSLTTRQNSNGDPFACYEVRESAGRNYMILNNPWGLGARDCDPTAQSTKFLGPRGDGVAWEVTFNGFVGDTTVKSYPNARRQLGLVPVGGFNSKSMVANWKWSWSGSGFMSNVAFDLMFFKDKDSTSNYYEIMVWLEKHGDPHPLGAENPLGVVNIGGRSFQTYAGSNSYGQYCVSFVLQGSAGAGGVDGLDLSPFVKHVLCAPGVTDGPKGNIGKCLSTNAVMNTVDAGIEPFTGSATFTTSYYSLNW